MDSDNLLSCPICMERFVMPRMLPCQHTLCHACLESYIAERRLDHQIPCPICRQDVKPSMKNKTGHITDCFPTNLLLVSLLDIDNASEKNDTCPYHVDSELDSLCISHKTLICSHCRNTKQHMNCEIVHANDHAKSPEFHSYSNKMDDALALCHQRFQEIVQYSEKHEITLGQEKISCLEAGRLIINRAKLHLSLLEEELIAKTNAIYELGTEKLAKCKQQSKAYYLEIEQLRSKLSSLPATENSCARIQVLLEAEKRIQDYLQVDHAMRKETEFVSLQLCKGSDDTPFSSDFDKSLQIETKKSKMILKPLNVEKIVSNLRQVSSLADIAKEKAIKEDQGNRPRLDGKRQGGGKKGKTKRQRAKNDYGPGRIQAEQPDHIENEDMEPVPTQEETLRFSEYVLEALILIPLQNAEQKWYHPHRIRAFLLLLYILCLLTFILYFHESFVYALLIGFSITILAELSQLWKNRFRADFVAREFLMLSIEFIAMIVFLYGVVLLYVLVIGPEHVPFFDPKTSGGMCIRYDGLQTYIYLVNSIFKSYLDQIKLNFGRLLVRSLGI